ncbi:endoplasmic reticulum resident protein 29 [Fopius arisanus]|uniref:Endoplasmic reticulum resident protein 29 n=1 Tax=Fopius arisanus TaxID=64838 RepID=A0A9R1SV25_9HYME|nr:PREDICTED: endoplasmic reticulum resident protein 29 [Fopius arisanus]
MGSVVPVLIVVGAVLGLGFAEDCKGCVPLDSYSFDKVISKFRAAIVKFDVAFPYGEKHEAFANVAAEIRDTEDLILAEVGVKDYGNKDNSDLVKRFDIDRKDFPVIMLFSQGQSQPVRLMDGNEPDFTVEHLKRLIRSKAGIYVGLPGCVEQLDRLAEDFRTAQEKERQEILKKAKVFQETVPEEHRSAAQVYVKMMEKILERGDVFVQSEQTRIEGLLKGKLSDEKKRTMEKKRNILLSFHHRDEL